MLVRQPAGEPKQQFVAQQVGFWHRHVAPPCLVSGAGFPAAFRTISRAPGLVNCPLTPTCDQPRTGPEFRILTAISTPVRVTPSRAHLNGISAKRTAHPYERVDNIGRNINVRA